MISTLKKKTSFCWKENNCAISKLWPCLDVLVQHIDCSKGFDLEEKSGFKSIQNEYFTLLLFSLCHNDNLKHFFRNKQKCPCKRVKAKYAFAFQGDIIIIYNVPRLITRKLKLTLYFQFYICIMLKPTCYMMVASFNTKHVQKCWGWSHMLYSNAFQCILDHFEKL